MADLVNEIISPEAFKQLEKAMGDIEFLTEQIAELAKAGKTIQFEFKGVKDFATADDLLKKATESMRKFEHLQGKLTNTTKDAALAAERLAKANLAEAKTSEVNARALRLQKNYTEELNNEKEKLLKKFEKAQEVTKKLSNEYEGLKRQYKAQADEAKRLGAALGVESAAFKAASANAMKLHTQLLAIESAVGQSQRNVGNYAGALMSVSQILREAPAFANSFQTGLMAIGNNLPILGDEFKKLRAEVGALKAAGILLGSVFSASNLFILGFTAFQFLSKYIHDAKKATDEYAKSLREAEKQGIANAASEQAHASALIDIAKNERIAKDVRLRAVKQLQELYPSYFGNLKEEAILNGNITKEVEALNKALFAKAMMQAQNEKLVANAKQFDELTDSIATAKTELDDLQKKQEKFNKTIAVSDVNTPVTAAIKHEIERAKKNLNDLALAMDKNKRDRENIINRRSQFAIDAGDLAVDAEKEKKKKGKKERKISTSFEGDSSYADSVFQLDKQRLERQATIQKEIADNEKEGIQTRLDANIKYQQALLAIAELEADKEIAVATAKYNELDLRKKDAKGRELLQLQIAQAAQKNFIASAVAKQVNAEEDILKNGRKDVLNIIKSSNEQWIADQSEAFNDLKNQEMLLYLTEEKLLLDALEKKQISRKQYDKAVLDLQKKQHIAFLEAEVAFDEKLLENDNLTSEQRLKLEEDIVKKRESLFTMKNGGKAEVGNKGGRVTDSLAQLFMPEGMADDEKYLQEFYDRSVQLANQAADAIIAAHNREYEARIEQLNKEEEAIKRNTDEKIRAINATAATQIEKQNQIKLLNAQSAAQLNEVEDAKKQAAIKQARFEKAAAIASIIQNTAVAIAGALKYGPLAPPIIALIAAAGAVQLASASSAPIPAYKDGTTNHPGSYFIAGDGGEPEYIKAPGKAGYWSKSSPTLYNEAAGTSVTPLSRFMSANITGASAFTSPDSTGAINGMKDAITNKLDEHAKVMAMAMRANRTIVGKDAALAFEMKRQRK